MAKAFVPKILSANDLTDGVSVFLTTDNEWSTNHRDAQVAYDETSAEALLSLADGYGNEVVGPYLVDVLTDVDGLPQPRPLRELLRTLGPSVDFGYRSGYRQTK
ncbi:MAG: DUF2849 domain-containing protein [Pseudomonadales bacterium]